MPDREKVISQCKQAIDSGNPVMDYHFYYEVLAMLKEQEPAKPRTDEENDHHCGSCDAIVGWEEITCVGLTPYVYNYCPVCGRKVLWE